VNVLFRNLLTLCLALLCSSYAIAEPATPVSKIELEDGDTLVFLGDSITHQCLYTQYLEDFFYTRYPSKRIEFHNAGVGGDRANDALIRFDQDVAAFKPKYVTILLGMNDGSYTRFEQNIFDTYEKNMTTLLDQISASGATAIPMTPTMYDSRASVLHRKGDPDALKNRYYNGVLAFYGAWLQEQANNRGLGFVDMYGPLNLLTMQERKKDASFTLIQDAVHPGAAGQVVMAFAVLNDMHVNRVVSTLTANTNGKNWTVRSTGGKVDGIGDADQLSFVFQAECLPWVLPEEANLGYVLTKAGHKMSNERIRVTGLSPGKYQLKIDDALVGTYTHSQLGAKVELQSNAKTPQYQQALAVAMLNKEKNEKAVRPMRGMWSQMKGQRRGLDQAVKAGKPEELAAKKAAFKKWNVEFTGKVAELNKQIGEYDDRIYELNQPKPRRYSLIKVEQ
jgi:lysophospholipase L1-like esterase